MKSIFLKSLEEIRQGVNYSIDLRSHTLKVGKKTYIDNGIPDGELIEDRLLPEKEQEEILVSLRERFHAFRHSIPSERSEKKTSRYFRALGTDELDAEDFISGQRRTEAQFVLEALVLIHILKGTLRWGEGALQGWFWQDIDEPGFVLLKEWFEK